MQQNRLRRRAGRLGAALLALAALPLLAFLLGLLLWKNSASNSRGDAVFVQAVPRTAERGLCSA